MTIRILHLCRHPDAGQDLGLGLGLDLDIVGFNLLDRFFGLTAREVFSDFSVYSVADRF